MICPYCSHQNLDGLDHCEECLHDLSFFDVPRAIGGLQQHLMEDTVNQVPFDRLVFVKPDDTVAHVVSRIKTIGIGQAIVVGDGRLVGILTERDLLYKVAGHDVDLTRITVSEVMTSHPEAVEASDAIRVVMNKMAVGGYRHVPIVKGGHPVGIVSAKALVNCILEHSELDF